MARLAVLTRCQFICPQFAELDLASGFYWGLLARVLVFIVLSTVDHVLPTEVQTVTKHSKPSFYSSEALRKIYGIKPCSLYYLVTRTTDNLLGIILRIWQHNENLSIWEKTRPMLSFVTNLMMLTSVMGWLSDKVTLFIHSHWIRNCIL